MVREALLLIDLQAAFVTGRWAGSFGLEQVRPIAKSFQRAGTLLRSGVLGSRPVLRTRCYLDDSPPDYLKAEVASLPWVHKPTTNVMLAPGFSAWLDEHRVEVLVIGGCTTTSCVRVSSQAVAAAYERVRVVVDMSLCGAREDGHNPALAKLDPVLLDLYGDDVEGRSAVDLAFLQMQRNGVEVVEQYEWT